MVIWSLLWSSPCVIFPISRRLPDEGRRGGSRIITLPLYLRENSIENVINGYNSTRNDYTTATRHAEIDALEKLPYKKINGKLDLIVIRLTKDGELKESRPCINCLRRLKARGVDIRHVYYSTNEGVIKREKFNGMENHVYVCSGYRRN